MEALVLKREHQYACHAARESTLARLDVAIEVVQASSDTRLKVKDVRELWPVVIVRRHLRVWLRLH